MTNQTQQQQPMTEAEWRKRELAHIRSTLERQKQEIGNALPEEIPAERFIRTALTAVQVNPDLLDADRQSLFLACMKAAQDGLLPDGREAVLNVYNTKTKVWEGNRQVEKWVPTVQYLPMVRGLLKLIRNSGEIGHVDAAAVYERDVFRFVRGDDPRLEHEPYLGEDDPGKIVAAYIVVRFTNGEVHREVMPRRDIEKVRGASKSGDGANSPWSKWYDQMAIKSVIKRAAKLLPNSSKRLESAIGHDNEDYEGFNQRGEVLDLGATAAVAGAAPAALTDGRAEQEARRPSRFGGIVNKAKQEAVRQPATDAQAQAQAAE